MSTGTLLAATPAMARTKPALFLGTSGYRYDAWHGVFYPEGLPKSRELSYASLVFNSLEINRSFYALLTPAACKAWFESTPAGFVFAMKGSRFITHNKKLRDVETALANFFASGPLALAEKLGPIVWQLPASLRYDEARLDAFFALLPRSLKDAAHLGARHDGRPKHGTFLEVQKDRPLLHVLEARHESFYTPACARLLRRHGVALAVSDSPDWRYVEEPTAKFMYVRLHGSSALYASRYTDRELDHWAAHIRAWLAGETPKDARRISRDSTWAHRPMAVYVYFDNDASGHAARDAQRLAQRLDLSWRPPPPTSSSRRRAARTVLAQAIS